MNARTLQLIGGSELQAGIVRGTPDTEAGDINLNVTENITLRGGSRILNFFILQDSPDSQGNLGDININTEELFLIGGSQILNQVRNTATGTAGDINITTSKLSIASGSQLINNTQGAGDSGNITIDAPDGEVSFEGANTLISLTIEGNAMGDAGQLNIATDSFSITTGARIQANTQGVGDAADINIEANTVELDGGIEQALPSAIFSQVRRIDDENIGMGNSGDINIIANDSLTLTNFAFISTSADADTTGEPGDITITTNDLRIDNGSSLNAFTNNLNNDGGDVTINADTLELAGGGKIFTTTGENGSAGNIDLNITTSIAIEDSESPVSSNQLSFEDPNIEISQSLGSGSGLWANTALGSTGSGGSIDIETGELSIADGGRISVSSRGAGKWGRTICELKCFQSR